jgi:hypothetical protein
VAPTWQEGVDSAAVRGYKTAVPLHQSPTATLARIAELEALLASERERTAQLEKERDVLKASHERLRLELELLKQPSSSSTPRARRAPRCWSSSSARNARS